MAVTLIKKAKKILAVILALAIAFAALCLAAFDTRLKIRKYEIEAEKVEKSIRVALVTDLHSCDYGKNQKKLVKAIEEQNPDVVFLVGDIFDDVLPDDNAEIFVSQISKKYPCYYVTGNHEWWSGKDAFLKKMAILEENGVIILKNEVKTVEINGETIDICGIDDPCAIVLEEGDALEGHTASIEKVGEESENYKILLSHRPERFETYTQYGFDLVVSGHAHGGQWRIPPLVNGVYAPHQGVFPKYAGGLYEDNGTTMIVSRGLARETTWVPRIFNRPELVIIDIK